MKGAVVAGERVEADIGGNLAIESLQDESRYQSKDQAIGGSITVGYGFAAGSASVSNSRINSNFKSVTEQTGIKAGDGGFAVDVRGNTELKGGVIASTDAAVAAGRNSFTTSSLTMSDIENQAEYEGRGFSVSGGYSTGETRDRQGNAIVNTDGTSRMVNTPSAGAGEDSGSAASVTKSGISGIAGNTDVRSNDAETGIKPIFDAEKVQKEVDAQVAITQKFNEIAPKAAADYTKSKVADLKRQAELETEPDKKSALLEEAQKWGPNGSYNIAMNILIGAAGGGATGAVSSITKESLSWAAYEMRQAMIEDSKKFSGICVFGTEDCISNASGQSDGVNGDGFKLAGGAYCT